jgi:PAS domain S-box-containing protein
VKRRARTSFERRIALLALLAGAPATLVATLMLAMHSGDGLRRWETLTVGLAVVAVQLALVGQLHARVSSTMRALANLVEAIRLRDFSIRASSDPDGGALGEVFLEMNALASSLRDQRLEAAEASALLQTVLAEVDVALFAIDQRGCVALVNAAGERLVGRSEAEMVGRSAEELGIGDWLDGPAPRMLEATQVLRRGGRWELRRAPFRRKGMPHQLLVLADVGRVLRVEERQAWQRLVRVLSHEVNNSLAPIQSIAHSQVAVLERATRGADWETDLRAGLDVVARRAESLGRFLASYASLARLPPPTPRPVDVADWVARAAKLETRVAVAIEPGPSSVVRADPDQLEQMLVNLVKNAAEATLPTRGGVRVRWWLALREVCVEVEDDGEGITDGANLFVPFFTTKPDGSGIGLALSRQIAEAHGGELTLENRKHARGCIARIRLPVAMA